MTISFDLDDLVGQAEATARGWDGTGNADDFLATILKSNIEMRQKRAAYKTAKTQAIIDAAQKVNADPAFAGVTDGTLPTVVITPVDQ